MADDNRRLLQTYADRDCNPGARKMKKKRRNANQRLQQAPQEDLLAQQVEGVLANVSPFGKQRYREMTDVLAGWPGTEEYDAALLI
jgi:hypothetical protein